MATTIQELKERLSTLDARSAEANELKGEIFKLEQHENPGDTGSVEPSFPTGFESGIFKSPDPDLDYSKYDINTYYKGRTKLGRGLGKRQGKQEPPVNLRYPDAEIHGDTDYLQIKIVKYKTVREVGGDTIVGKPGSRRNSAKESLGTILLPVPPSVEDRNTVNYQGSNINAITAAAVTGVSNVMEGGQTLMDAPKETMDKIGRQVMSLAEKTFSSAGGGATIIDLLTKSLASQAVGIFGGNVSVDQLLARNDGVIFNPNMELLFNGPGLRQFAFTFKMTPRSKTEGDKVRQIIRTFKLNMAPQVTEEGGGNLFLKTPNVFELSFMQGRNSHPFLNKFKQCFLSNVSVNYTGEGTHATYGDGTPISLVMTLQFQEIEPIYDIDYLDTDDGKTGVGY